MHQFEKAIIIRGAGDYRFYVECQGILDDINTLLVASDVDGPVSVTIAKPDGSPGCVNLRNVTLTEGDPGVLSDCIIAGDAGSASADWEVDETPVAARAPRGRRRLATRPMIVRAAGRANAARPRDGPGERGGVTGERGAGGRRGGVHRGRAPTKIDRVARGRRPRHPRSGVGRWSVD